MSVRRAQDERIEGTPDGNTAITEISDVPDAPTVSTITNTSFDGSVTVAATAVATGGTPTTFTITPTPATSPTTFTGASPVTVSGLSDATSYTFTATGVNSTATGPAGSASASTAIVTAGSYDSIASTTVGAGGTATVTFSSIPATYTHLQIRGLYRIPGNVLYFNVTTSAGVNYGVRRHYLSAGNGNSVYAGTDLGSSGNGTYIDLYVGGSMPANIFGGFVFDILDYANTGKYKTFRSLGGYEDAESSINIISGFFNTTNAITSIQLKGSSTIAQYSSFALYGIKGA